MRQTAIRLSIIVPVLNEIEGLVALRDWWHALDGREGVELIVCVAKGRAHDRSVQLARTFSEVLDQLTPSRAGQMNAGARRARGMSLFFLHIDSRPPVDFIECIRETLKQPEVSAGVFSHRFLEASTHTSLAVISGINRFRYGVTGNYYGDQGLFLKRQTFAEASGFPHLPILEDLHMVRNLRDLGRVECLPEVMKTSGRRFIKAGPWRTFFFMWGLLWKDFLGLNLKQDALRYNEHAFEAELQPANIICRP